MQGLPAVKFTESFRKFQITSYMVKYSLESLPQLLHLKSIALNYLEKRPDNEEAQARYVALERAIEQKQHLQDVKNVEEALL